MRCVGVLVVLWGVLSLVTTHPSTTRGRCASARTSNDPSSNTMGGDDLEAECCRDKNAGGIVFSRGLATNVGGCFNFGPCGNKFESTIDADMTDDGKTKICGNALQVLNGVGQFSEILKIAGNRFKPEVKCPKTRPIDYTNMDGANGDNNGNDAGIGFGPGGSMNGDCPNSGKRGHGGMKPIRKKQKSNCVSGVGNNRGENYFTGKNEGRRVFGKCSGSPNNKRGGKINCGGEGGYGGQKVYDTKQSRDPVYNDYNTKSCDSNIDDVEDDGEAYTALCSEENVNYNDAESEEPAELAPCRRIIPYCHKCKRPHNTCTCAAGNHDNESTNTKSKYQTREY